MGFEEAFQAADLAVQATYQEGLRDIERVVLEGAWDRLTYEQIALKAGYTAGYLSRDIGPALWKKLTKALNTSVSKTNFRTAIERWSQQHSSDDSSEPPPSPDTKDPDAYVPSIDVTDFRGREAELEQLSHWILSSRGRLLCLSGMAGVGKTWLAVKLAQVVESHFQPVIYRDLKGDRPPPGALIAELLTQLQVEVPPQASLTQQLERLTQALSQSQRLIILDSTEVLSHPGALAGTYESPFDGYAQMLDILATYDHQSCVIWVGRERLRAASPITGACRLHHVNGFHQTELPTLAFWPADLSATLTDWDYLRDRYGGLPSLIKGLVPRLMNFGNNLAACLEALRGDSQLVRTYLEEWLAALSQTEWQILIWLMISRQPLSLTQLSTYLGNAKPLSAIESLCDRGICCAIVNGEPQWDLVLPDLLSPYLRDRFIEAFEKADDQDRMAILHRYPLLQTDVPETVRQWQRQDLLGAIAQILAKRWPQLADKQHFLQQGFAFSRQQATPTAAQGYSAGNLINLSQYWQVSLTAVNCHDLFLREADLQSDCFQGVAFTRSDLSQTLLAKPLGECPAIAISPDQQQVAVGDQDGRLLLWNIHTGRLQRAMFSVPEAIEVITFSDDGCTLAEGRQDGQVRLWELASEYGPELFASTADGALTALAFSPDKQLLAGGDESGVLHIWRLASGQEIYRLQAHQAAVTAIAFSPCSRYLATCGQDCAALEWAVATGEWLHCFQGRLTNWLGTVAYLPTTTAPGMQAVVVGRDESQLVIWEIQSARPLRVMTDASDMVMAVALSPNGRYLAASDVSNTLSVWEVDSRSRLYQISDAKAPVESLVFSPDSHELMTGCDYTVQLWQVSSGHCLRSWRSDRHPAIGLTLGTAPLQLLSSHDDQTLRCWRAGTLPRWLPHSRLQVPDEVLISTITTSPQGRYWAIGTEAGRVHLWDSQQQTWLATTNRLPTSITALAVSLDEKLLIIGDALGTIALWDLTGPRVCWQKVQTHADKVTALAFSPDNYQVFSGSSDRTIQSWDIHGTRMMTLAKHHRKVHSLCPSADGRTLYSGSYDGTVRIWDLAQQTCALPWQQENRLIHCLTRDAQGCPLAIISDTTTLEIWDLAADVCRASLPPHPETVWHVSVSPDGQSLVSADQDGAIRIWSLESGQLRGQLRVDRPYEGMQIGGCTGLTESERQMLHSLGAIDD